MTSEAYSVFSTHQLQILLPGTKNGFVKPNVNLTGDPAVDHALMAPYLSGSPVTLKADLTIDIAKAADHVCGLLVYDGPGTSPLDGIGGADQSGVLTYVYGLATVEVPTRVLENVAFAINDPVYASANGKLTNVPGTGNIIGHVISAVNQAQDGLMIQMSI
jgi:hypothetical protein